MFMGKQQEKLDAAPVDLITYSNREPAVWASAKLRRGKVEEGGGAGARGKELMGFTTVNLV